MTFICTCDSFNSFNTNGYQHMCKDMADYAFDQSTLSIKQVQIV